MIVRLLTVVLSAVLLAPFVNAQNNSTTTVRVASDGWYNLVSTDGAFAISFPEKPNQEPDGQGPNSAIHNYGLYSKNRMRFSINFQNAAGDPNSSINNEWNDSYEAAVLASDRDQKRRVVSIRRIGKNIFEQEVWDSNAPSGESINYLIQTIVRQGRIYTLLCGSEIYGQPLNKSTCRRFLDSFRFVDSDKRASSR